MRPLPTLGNGAYWNWALGKLGSSSYFYNLRPTHRSSFFSPWPCYTCSWWACPDCCSCWDADTSLRHQSYPVGSISDNCSALHPLTEQSSHILVFLLLLSTKNRPVYFSIHCGGHVAAVPSVPSPVTDLQEGRKYHRQAWQPRHFTQGSFLIEWFTISCFQSSGTLILKQRSNMCGISCYSHCSFIFLAQAIYCMHILYHVER